MFTDILILNCFQESVILRYWVSLKTRLAFRVPNLYISNHY